MFSRPPQKSPPRRAFLWMPATRCTGCDEPDGAGVVYRTVFVCRTGANAMAIAYLPLKAWHQPNAKASQPPQRPAVRGRLPARHTRQIKTLLPTMFPTATLLLTQKNRRSGFFFSAEPIRSACPPRTSRRDPPWQKRCDLADPYASRKP